MATTREKGASQERQRVRGFNTKGYFHMAEPYCQEYLKVKHESYQKTRQLRELKTKDKQNTRIMFEFNVPKSGFYMLKGCKAKPIQQQKTSKQAGADLQMIRDKSELVSHFMKKYQRRKEKLQRRQKSQALLPAVRINPPYLPLSSITQQYENVRNRQSSEIGTLITNQRFTLRKLRTEPIDKVRGKNKSCHQLQKNHKISVNQPLQSMISVCNF